MIKEIAHTLKRHYDYWERSVGEVLDDWRAALGDFHTVTRYASAPEHFQMFAREFQKGMEQLFATPKTFNHSSPILAGAVIPPSLIVAGALLAVACSDSSVEAPDAGTDASIPVRPYPFATQITEARLENGRRVPLKIWYPTDAPGDDHLSSRGRPFAAVYNSHGSTDDFDTQGYLGEELSGYGIVFVALDHRDDPDCDPCTDPPRALDLHAARRHMRRQTELKDSIWYQALDDSRVGLSGHSRGGYAILEFAARFAFGTTPPFPVQAILAMEPAGDPGAEGLADIQSPVMIMTSSNTTDKKSRVHRTLFERIRSPRWLATFWSMHHASFSYVGSSRQHGRINDLSLPFFLHHLSGDDGDPKYEGRPASEILSTTEGKGYTLEFLPEKTPAK